MWIRAQCRGSKLSEFSMNPPRFIVERKTAMQKITPFLWFDNQAEEAINFYSAIFKNSNIGKVSRYDEAGAAASGRPKGSVMTASFQLNGQEFMALNGGPHFKFNPSISFFVTCETEAEVDNLWQYLHEGGTALMELQKYDWSDKYGWVQDKFGLSWQINLGRQEEVGQFITPSLLFVGKQHGKAGEAVHFYTSVFENSNIIGILHYQAGEVEPEGTVKHARFTLHGEVFMAMDSSLGHAFAFNEAISFVVNCESQKEVDYYWEKLSEGGDATAQQCGWLKDKFGLSWQIVPTILGKLLQGGDAEKSQRVMKALLQMKKIDIEGLKKAYNG